VLPGRADGIGRCTLDGVPAPDPAPDESVIVAQDVFGGSRFWAALDRLADRRGHHEHPGN
jgi:hypothetical protein